MKRLIVLLLGLSLTFGFAQLQAAGKSGKNKVTLVAVNQPAASVIRNVAGQTGMNFVYSSEILQDVMINVKLRNKSLRKSLEEIFRHTDIDFKIDGRNIVLKKRPRGIDVSRVRQRHSEKPVENSDTVVLEEVVVESRLEAPTVETSEIGAKKLSVADILNTPSLFGENDVLKALQLQPGINGSAEGMASMSVHGGNTDENLFMLDNVPLYEVNHFMGFFSAFNINAVRYIDFFKSSIPAKYDGRLSSYLDVRTKSGSQEGHHGSAKLGLTSGAINIDGPLGKNTTYSVAARRSWFDLISIPIVALANSGDEDNKISFGYAFIDLNAKVTHRFNSRATGFASVYFGDDYLKSGSEERWYQNNEIFDKEDYKVHWGNFLAQTGFNYKITPAIKGEFTAAYTRFFSSTKEKYHIREYLPSSGIGTPSVSETKSFQNTKNNINDILLRADFDWMPDESSRVRFGGGYTLHRFLPACNYREFSTATSSITVRDSLTRYHANEVNLYIEDDWRISRKLMLNAGIHGSMFAIDGKSYFGYGPRLSASCRPVENLAVKGAFSRTNQYVHQLQRTYLALPSDQWVPVNGRLKPQSADKVAAGIFLQSKNNVYAFSVEGYYKWMKNLIEYRDEYYLMPPLQVWDSQLCSGKGSARGLDFKIEKLAGKFTGHVSYSLSKADRTFPDKNGGRTFPARFDQTHSINILVNWNLNRRIQLSAAWIGHSGNRFTMLSQVWQGPDVGYYWGDESMLKAGINNYRLPFYHRLDLSMSLKTRRGFWNFSIFNAYCHMNTVAIVRKYDDESHFYDEFGGTYYHDSKPVFKKFKFLPLIPSVSYTWIF